MISFMDTVKNWGDFATRPVQLGNGVVQDPTQRYSAQPAHMLEAYAGSQAQDVNEPGYARRWSAAQALQGTRRRMWEADMMEATRLIKRTFDGDELARYYFKRAMNGGMREAMSISDFPNLFGDVIDRSVLANYMETPYTWNMIAHEAEVNDFRPVKRFVVNGGTGLLGPTSTSASVTGNLVPLEQGANYPEDSLSVPAPYTYQLFKRGKRMPFFWETFVNDDLNAIKDTPARFGRGARREEEYFVTGLFANNATMFSNANKNIVNATNVGDSGTNNPAFNITALQRAIIVLMQQLDSTGQPISVEAMTLVVPPSLKTVAMNVLNTDYVWMADQGGTQQINGSNLSATVAQQLHALNWAKNIVRLAVNYYLPIVDTTHGQTGWYLFSNPESGRPAIEFGKLRGHRMPELFMKLPNSVAIGEGAMGPGPGVFPGNSSGNPMEGDFDTDSVHYKIRAIKGGAVMDPIMAVYSNGSGS